MLFTTPVLPSSIPASVKSFLGKLSHLLHHHDPRVIGGIVVAAILIAVLLWLYARSRRPSAEELERRRRHYLAAFGRITDGVILDTRTLSGEETTSPTPEVLVFGYSFAGVTYNCAQDVSGFPDLVAGIRLDQAVQVRYDPRNPGNSILVAEEWTGLWLRGHAIGKGS
jgi:hypothetical protein